MKFTKNDNAFTGLEAAIVLIAFVVVAAVFSYVVLGAGFFTTQKAQESVYTSVAQATSNIQVVGQVYGIASGGATAGGTQINQVQFSIGLAPGSPTLDISKMKIVFSTPTTTPVIYPAQAVGTCTPDTTTFCAQIDGAGDNVGTLQGQQQIQILFKVTPTVRKNVEVNIEIRPAVGAALPFSKTTPPSITGMNVLY
jgi:flagellin FlaB